VSRKRDFETRFKALRYNSIHSYTPSAYPWPSSALNPADMRLLYLVRETAPTRIPINQLIALAVRQAYASVATEPQPRRPTDETDHPEKLAA